MNKQFAFYLTKKTLGFFVLSASVALLNSCKTRMVTQKSNTGMANQSSEKGLKDYYKNYFPIGVAVSPFKGNLSGDEAKLVLQHFNSLTAENDMKAGPIHPEENRYNWTAADSIVEFAQRHGLKIRGHNLLWHQQGPRWIFTDAKGDTVTKEVLTQRLKEHIKTVVNRYKGKIYGWDVVNEAIDDNPNNFLRNSPWYKIGGEEIIARAFEYAHAADPDAILFYNDYNEARPEKRERIYKLLKRLVDAKVPIHGMGMQAHWSVYEPNEKDLRDAIERYASLGLKIQITELDVSPWEKDARKRSSSETYAMSPELDQKQAEQYGKLFKIFREYKNVITGVTFWNLTDKYSWMNNRPPGSNHHPLLFDENLKPKKAYWEVVKFE